MMTRLVFFCLVLVSFSRAELMPAVADEVCELSGVVTMSQYQDPGGVMQAQGDDVTVDSAGHDLDESCKGSTGCEKTSLRKPFGKGDGYRVITYTF